MISCRTNFKASQIILIYDDLLEWKLNNRIPGRLVVSNSWGSYVCSPPLDLPADFPLFQNIHSLIAAGICFVFAAGNNHTLCKHSPTGQTPTTIWGANSLDQVLSVGTVNRAGTNQDPTTPHVQSSRGTGQHARANPKPDCVAPTYGEVRWGDGYRHMDWWGTSGACPQVAGLAALLLSANPTLNPGNVSDVIRNTCTAPAGGAVHSPCVGRGIINCAAAVASV